MPPDKNASPYSRLPTRVSIIAAMAENRVIGADNEIPWYIPEDFKHFKAVTLGKPCIMGRKTYESILEKLGKPLPGRTSIVISRTPTSLKDDHPITPPSLESGHPPNPPSLEGGGQGEGVKFTRSIEDAITLAKTIAEKDNVDEIMVIGGAQIYEQTLPLANRMYLTRVHQSPDGDAHFPDFNENEWETETWHEFDGYTITVLER